MDSVSTAPGAPAALWRLMRRPLAGGPPEMVYEAPVGAFTGYWCPPKPGAGCVLSQIEGTDHILYSFDPVRGKGNRIGTIGGAGDWPRYWLSPDGSHMAVIKVSERKDQINVLTLSDHTWHAVSVEPGWGYFLSIAWAADGKGFYLTSFQADSANLLYVTLAGKVKLLLRGGLQEMDNPLPSPDGKYLAYEAETRDSNAWMLENF
jgi:Tol biopolymer transport system component